MSDNRMTNDTEKLYERLISDPVIRLQPDTILKFLERLHSCHKQRINELESQLKELRNLREVDRVSDQSIELTFSSCRACSAFCKVIERIKEQDHE